MTLYLDLKYINLISSTLIKFTKVDRYTYTFRCPFCGDSKKNKNRTRGYFYRSVDNHGFSNQNISYKCHNCGYSTYFQNFLKMTNPSQYRSYIFDKFSSRETPQTENEKLQEKFKISSPSFDKFSLANLQTISDLDNNHIAKKTLLSRCIPTNFFNILYYTDKFNHWVNTLIPGKFNEEKDYPRIIIPFFNINKKVVGFQGRSISKNTIKYITIKQHKETPKIYGLERINFNKHIYCVEGPFDSLFVDNCIATMDSDLIGNNIVTPKNSTIIFDNEPRNKNNIRRIERAINKGFSVCIFPDNIKEKDINDIILSGVSKKKVKELIEKNTFSGLSANLIFNKWKKC